MSGNTIFCYSGTGNSLAAAKQLAQKFNFPVKMITKELIDQKQIIECDICIIIYPTYAYGLPLSVRDFIKTAQFKVEYLAVLTTFGTRPGGSMGEAVRLFRRKKQKVSFCNGIKTVENYIHIFGLAKDKKLVKQIENQRITTDEIAVKIKNRELNRKNTFTPLSIFISGLFRFVKPLFAITYKITEDCSGCGVCTKVCPTKAAKMQEKNNKRIPVFKANKCDHCQACMQLCPTKAIKYMRITPKSRRYLHTDIVLNEMIKRESDSSELDKIF